MLLLLSSWLKMLTGRPTSSSVHCCWRPVPPPCKGMMLWNASSAQMETEETREPMRSLRRLSWGLERGQHGNCEAISQIEGYQQVWVFSVLLCCSQFSWGFRKPSSRSLPWLWALSDSPNSVSLWKSPLVSYPFGILKMKLSLRSNKRTSVKVLKQLTFGDEML